jgi:hypothetical protein
MYLRWGLFVPALALSLPALAATVQPEKSQVSLNRGTGFKTINSSTTAKPGDIVMAGPTGSAEIIYDDGCRQKVESGAVATVSDTSPCKVGLAPQQEMTLVVAGFAAANGAGALLISMGGGGGKAHGASP